MRVMLCIAVLILGAGLALSASFFVTGVDVSHYPEVLVYASMEGRNPETCTFTVKEGGHTFNIYGLKKLTELETRKVDFIFVFDVTGSMEDEIRGVVRKAKQFADMVEKAGYDYRFSLVTFRDEIVKGDYGFTSNLETFKGWVGSLVAKEGGDDPELALDALAYAVRLPVRKDATRVIVLITDAPYHYKGDGSGYSKYTPETVKDMILKGNFTLFAIAPDIKEYRGLVVGVGKLFDIHSSEDFGRILDSVATTFVKQFTFKYKTIDRMPGEKVSFIVKAGGSGGILEAGGSYTVPSRPEVEEQEICMEGFAFLDPTIEYGRALAMAREAAILDAQRQILEYLKGVKIAGETTVSDLMLTDEKVRTVVEGIVKCAQVIEENVDKDMEAYIAKVKVDFKPISDAYYTSSGFEYVWHENMIKARGIVAVNKRIKPLKRAVLVARRGAIAEAQKQLLAAIKGVYITSQTRVEDKVAQSDVIRAKVEGVLRGAFVIEECDFSEAMEKGYYWVVMGVHISGDESLYKALGETVKIEEPDVPDVKETTSRKKDEKLYPAPIPITSIVVDASKLGLKFSLAGYSIVTTTGKLIYKPSMRSNESLPPVIYTLDVESALKLPETGENPYIVKAVKVEGDVVYVEVDEEFLAATFKAKDIRREGRIILTLGGEGV